MLRRRSKTEIEPEGMLCESDAPAEQELYGDLTAGSAAGAVRDYFKFAVYCMLLAIPLYAITKSVLKHDWIMVIVDALIVPVGFVHGLLLLFGYVT